MRIGFWIGSLFLACIGGCAGPPPLQDPAADGALGRALPRIWQKPPPVGLVTTLKESFSLKLDVMVHRDDGSEKLRYAAEKKLVRRTTRLAGELNASLLFVEYLRLDEERSVNGRRHAKRSPLEDNEYLVRVSDDDVLIKSGYGGPVGASERQLVLSDIRSPSDMGSFLPMRPVRVGETFEPDQQALDRMLPGFGRGVQSMQLTVSGTETVDGRECVVLTTRADVVLSGPPAVLARLSGRILLQTQTAWPVEVSLEGPIEVVEKSETVRMEGSGKVRATSRGRYRL